MDSSHAELLRNAIVRVIEESGCTSGRGILSGSLVPLTERDVCLPDWPVQRVIRTERPIAEKCRVLHLVVTPRRLSPVGQAVFHTVKLLGESKAGRLACRVLAKLRLYDMNDYVQKL